MIISGKSYDAKAAKIMIINDATSIFNTISSYLCRNIYFW